MEKSNFKKMPIEELAKLLLSSSFDTVFVFADKKGLDAWDIDGIYRTRGKISNDYLIIDSHSGDTPICAALGNPGVLEDMQAQTSSSDPNYVYNMQLDIITEAIKEYMQRFEMSDTIYVTKKIALTQES